MIWHFLCSMTLTAFEDTDSEPKVLFFWQYLGFLFNFWKSTTSLPYLQTDRNTRSHVYIYVGLVSGGGSFKNRKPIGEIGCCEL